MVVDTGMGSAIPIRRHPGRSWPGILATAVFAVACVLLFLRIGEPPATNALDGSWTAVLGWAHANGARWGTDIAFTFGPLGYLTPTASYLPDSFEDFWRGQVALSLATGAILAWLFWRLSPLLRVALVVLVALNFIWMVGDVLWFATMAALAPMLAASLKHRPGAAVTVPLVVLVIALASYGCVLVLIKLSLLPLLVAHWLATTAMLWQARGRPGALLGFLALPVVFVGTWLLAGQGLDDLPQHLAATAQFMAGYGPAMSRGAGPEVDRIAFTCLVLVSALLAWRAWSLRHERIDLLAAGMVLLVLALSWRSVMTRIVPEKLLLVFPLFGLLLLLGHALGRASALQRTLGLVAVVILGAGSLAHSPWPWHQLVAAIAPATMARNAAALVSVDPVREQWRGQWLSARQEHLMPLTRAAVGEATVDLVSHAQGLLLLNGLNYHPRPVFQSYAAYTPALTRRNEAFLLGDDAPDFVMISAESMDGHLLSSEDPLGFLALVLRYEPVLAEGDFVLLRRSERRPLPARPPGEDRWQRRSLGELIELPEAPPGHLTIVHARIEPSLAGRAVAAMWREPRLSLDIGTRSGLFLPAALQRRSAEVGFVIDPVLLDTADLVRALTGMPASEHTGEVRRFRIVPTTPGELGHFSESILVAIEHRPWPRTTTGPWHASLVDKVYPGFGLVPVAQSGNIQVRTDTGRPVLFMHAPAQLEFELDAGTYLLQASAGIFAEMAGRPDCATADGVDVVIEHAGAEDGTTALASWAIAPPQPADEGANRSQLRTEVALPAPGRIRLRIDPGAAADIQCDWAFVRDVQVTAVPALPALGFEPPP